MNCRDDVDVETMPSGQKKDWAKFAPGVSPGELVATRFNPVLAMPADHIAL